MAYGEVMMKEKIRKTYSRETFWTMIVFVGYLSYRGDVETVNLLVWPIMTFGLAAFGFKQEVIQDFVKSRKTHRTELDMDNY